MVTVPPPVGLGRDTAARRRARERLAATLWGPRGGRRLPTDRALVRALVACDPRDVWWTCEMSSAGPVYLLPTREWITAFARYLRGLTRGAIVEVGAGDGFLARCLRRRGLEVHATDDGSWSAPTARMNAAERRALRDVPVKGLAPGRDVVVCSLEDAVARWRPEVLLVSWAPPGGLVERMILSPVAHVVEVGVEGDVTGDDARTWRYDKDFVEGEVESRALCRLDARPAQGRHTRVTRYTAGAEVSDDAWGLRPGG